MRLALVTCSLPWDSTYIGMTHVSKFLSCDANEVDDLFHAML